MKSHANRERQGWELHPQLWRNEAKVLPAQQFQLWVSVAQFVSWLDHVYRYMWSLPLSHHRALRWHAGEAPSEVPGLDGASEGEARRLCLPAPLRGLPAEVCGLQAMAQTVKHHWTDLPTRVSGLKQMSVCSSAQVQAPVSSHLASLEGSASDRGGETPHTPGL